jgi:CheY-like chemotaxis protein
VRVSDTGNGIAPEIRDRLFEPFFTTKSGKRGLGLGLTVVYGIVRNHQGFIDVVSEPGRGTSFEIYFPSTATHVGGYEQEAYASSIAAGEGGVLLVDDEDQIRQMGERVLQRAGYRVYLAANGKDALQTYRAVWEEVDVVILDVVMPEMDGRACFERIREVNPEAKILVMTGYTSDGSVREFLSKGAVGIVEKPFEIQELTEAVRRAVLDEGGAGES